MEARIREECGTDDLCRLSYTIGYLRERSIFKTPIGIKLVQKLYDGTGSQVGVLQTNLAFDDAKRLSNELLRLLAYRITDEDCRP